MRSATLSGETPTYAAAEQGNVVGLCLLVGLAVDVNEARRSDGATPAFAAARGGHLGCLRLLLKAGADAHRATNDNRTTVYAAAYKGQARCLELLISEGVDVNRAATSDGAAPVHVAAKEGHAGCLRQLIAAGADPCKKTNDGKSALDIILAIARKRGDEETVRIFEQHVATNAAVNAVAQRARAQAAVCLSCHKEGVPPGATGQGGDAQVTLLQCEGCGDALYCSKEVRKDEEGRG